MEWLDQRDRFTRLREAEHMYEEYCECRMCLYMEKHNVDDLYELDKDQKTITNEALKFTWYHIENKADNGKQQEEATAYA